MPRLSLPHHLRFGAGAPAMVFVHGFACAHDDWHAQLLHFAPRHASLACDLPGHGATPGAAEDATIASYAGCVVDLVAALEGPRAVLIGHSLGCRVVLQAAGDAPGRIAGVVLIDGSCIGRGDPATARSGAAEAIRRDGFEGFSRSLFSAMFLDGADPQLKLRIIGRAARLPEEIGSALFPDMVGWDASRMDAALAAVRAPILVIQSSYLNAERKRVPLASGDTTPWLDLVRVKVPSARIEIVSGVGHFPQIEAADAVNGLIEDFVSSLR